MITKQLIERDIKVLSEDKYTKQDVLSEMQNIANHLKSNTLPGITEADVKKIIDYLVLNIEADGFCVSYNPKTNTGNKQNAIVVNKGNKKKYIIGNLHRFFKGNMCKSFKQRLEEKYSKFVKENDMDNLSERNLGYLQCLQQFMVMYKLMESHDFYKPKEDSNN